MTEQWAPRQVRNNLTISHKKNPWESNINIYDAIIIQQCLSGASSDLSEVRTIWPDHWNTSVLGALSAVCSVSFILAIIVYDVQFEDEYVMALFCYVLLYYA